MGKRGLENAQLQEKDILIIRANPASLQTIIKETGMSLIGEVTLSENDLNTEEVSVMEAVVTPESRLDDRSFQGLRLRSRYGIALLGISRQGKAFKERLNHVTLRAGDIVLFQGETDTLADAVKRFGCLPLAERGLQINSKRRALRPVIIFGIALLLTAFEIIPVHISFTLAVVTLVLIKTITAREAYESIDWPIIILLGAMIPIGRALETTGGTALIASGFLDMAADIHPVFILTMLMIVTMTLSDIMNNAATAVVMAPIAVTIAAQLGLNPDPFLMSVAIGASCAFLTPIGHQNNILVMGPAGYHFGDYWRLGLPLEILIIFVSIPLIYFIWPL